MRITKAAFLLGGSIDGVDRPSERWRSGPVVMRRLNNAELDYTLQDLTGIAELKPQHGSPLTALPGKVS